MFTEKYTERLVERFMEKFTEKMLLKDFRMRRRTVIVCVVCFFCREVELHVPEHFGLVAKHFLQIRGLFVESYDKVSVNLCYICLNHFLRE